MTTATVTALSFDPQELQQIMEQGENASSFLKNMQASFVKSTKKIEISPLFIFSKNGNTVLPNLS